MIVGVLFSVVAGAALPISTVFVGDMVDAMSLWEQRLISVEAFLTAIETKVLIYLYLAGMGILNNSHNIRFDLHIYGHFYSLL